MAGSNARPLRTAGMLIGMGMGGFLDGIVFHQILQLHNMLSGYYYPDTLAHVDLNMFWDGIFHALTWTITAAGIFQLWRASKRADARWDGNLLLGSLCLGWGIFNLVEGIVDHHILQVHNLVQRSLGTERLLWDLLFDASGVMLIALGLYIMKRIPGPIRTRAS